MGINFLWCGDIFFQGITGVQILCEPESEGSTWRERAAQMYTWREADSPLGPLAWFPCVDSSSELCTWKIEVTCETTLTAVCSGELQVGEIFSQQG